MGHPPSEPEKKKKKKKTKSEPGVVVFSRSPLTSSRRKRRACPSPPAEYAALFNSDDVRDIETETTAIMFRDNNDADGDDNEGACDGELLDAGEREKRKKKKKGNEPKPP